MTSQRYVAVARSTEPKPTDGLYRKVYVDFTDGMRNQFEARYDAAEGGWLCPDGSLVWPTSWDAEPLTNQPKEGHKQ